MNAIQNSIIKDITLAPEGHLKIDWASAHMPVLNRIREQFEEEQPFRGLKVAISLHLGGEDGLLGEGRASRRRGSDDYGQQSAVDAGRCMRGARGRRHYCVCQVQSASRKNTSRC